MSRLSTEAQTITTDNLLAGIADTFLHLRFATLAGQISFQSTAHDRNNWVIETGLPSGSSTQSSYNNNVASGTGSRHKVKISTGHLARNADTPMKDIRAASNENDARATYRESAAKKLAYDFENQMVNGTALAPNLHGFEYYLTRYGGFARPSGSYNQINNSWPNFEHRKVFWCESTKASDDYRFPLDPSGSHSKNPLSMRALDVFLDRAHGLGFDAIVTTEKSFRWVLQLLRLESGGNTVDIYEDEDYGMRVIAYRGVPFARLDHKMEGLDSAGVGAKKVADPDKNYGIEIGGTSSTEDLTINDPGADPDEDWIGFTDLDIGRDIELDPDGSGNGPETVTILDVKDRRTAVVNPSNTYSGEDAEVKRTEAMYGVNFARDNGFSALYNPGDEDGGFDTGDAQTEEILGFSARDLGEVQSEGRKKRDAFDWFGTWRADSIYALARMSHYKAPATP